MHDGIVVPSVLYRAEWGGFLAEECRWLNVFEMKCLRSMTGVTMRDRIKNDVVQIRTLLVRKLEDSRFTYPEVVRAHGEDG